MVTTISSDLQKNWRDLPDVFEQGVDTIPQLLLHQASRFGDQVLHRKKDFGIWQHFTWNDVVEEVKTFAMGLASLGFKRGQTLAMIGENEPELFWGEYAGLAIGAKCVAMYPDLTANQMEYMIVHCESVMVLCEDQEQVDKVLEIEDKLPAIQKIIYWDDRGMWKYNNPKLLTFHQVQDLGREYIRRHPNLFEEEVAAGRGDDIAVLSYTSGTSALPKACISNHRVLFDTALRVTGAVYMKPFTQYLSYISPAWATEQMFGITIGLLLPMVVNFPEEPSTVTENIREIGTEAVVLTPRQWESLASEVESKMMDAGPTRQRLYRWGMDVGAKVNLSRLEGKEVPFWARLLYPLADKVVLYHLRDNLGLQSAYLAVSGGSGMAPDVFRFFHAMGVKLRNVFGTTEMGLLTLHQCDAYDLETVGKWLPVHPRFGAPLAYKTSDKGELLVKGGVGFLGYYKDKKATEEASDEGWYCMGDTVNITDKNEIVYLDRVKDMRELSTGHRFPPQFIETRLRFSPFIKDAMTLGDKDKPFVSAFINIDISTLGPWAEQRKIGYTTFTDLSQNEKIREVIKKEIEKVNYFLPEGSKVMKFINLPKELDPDEDELTRTRKLRRGFLEQKYAAFVAAIYTGEARLNAEVPVKYQDGRIGTLNAVVYVNNLEEGGK